MNGWFKKNLGITLTLILIFVGLVTSAVTLKVDQTYLARQVSDNCELDVRQADDINAVKGDIQEIKAILQRVERYMIRAGDPDLGE